MNAAAYFELVRITEKLRNDVDKIKIKLAELESLGIIPPELDDDIKQIIGE